MSPSSTDWYRQLLDEGKCRCGKPVVPGKSRCKKCLRKMSRAAKKRYAKYRSDNRCRRCPLPPLPGHNHCRDHNDQANASAKKAVAKLIKARLDKRECVRCGEASLTYNCKKCRRKIRRKAKRRLAT